MVLVVAQPDVVGRPVALDQVVLEGERLHLAVGDHEVEVGDLLDHSGLVELGRPRGLEVGADAVAQHAGLADVDDLALGVLEQVDAGPGRQLLELLGERHGLRPAAAERAGSAGRRATMRDERRAHEAACSARPPPVPEPLEDHDHAPRSRPGSRSRRARSGAGAARELRASPVAATRQRRRAQDRRGRDARRRQHVAGGRAGAPRSTHRPGTTLRSGAQRAS